MKILHIFNSEPGADVLDLVDMQAKNDQVNVIKLYNGDDVDYDGIIAQIAVTDKVVSWNNISD
ncbi:MAG: hypothetical protein OEZ68_17190 [Gammaproteobacteria bacterium]|nr:hypothetical protein [Gammaproteobacteria bacterium]MDH5802539.1 hypothetical protein [Gammaproteobacteria bacterium]